MEIDVAAHESPGQNFESKYTDKMKLIEEKVVNRNYVEVT